MATVTPHDVKSAQEGGRERGRGAHKGQQTRAAILDAALSLAAQMGIEGLSIADGSIFPEMPTVNPVVATFMIGEKAADLVRGRNS